MKILTSSQLHKADAYTIEHQKISSWELMERASLCTVDELVKLIDKEQSITILSGSGNNGGDGLAIAFHLDQLGYQVNVKLLQYTPELSPDCEKNLDRLKAQTNIPISYFNKSSTSFNIDFSSVIVDAVFGIGLNRSLPEFVDIITNTANQTKAIKIAIDVPSGMYLNKLTPIASTVFQANHTLTFQCPKLNFFLPDFGNAVGQLKILDIDLDQSFISNLETAYEYVDVTFIKTILKPRKRFTHKGSYGHNLIIGGQYGMMGSVCLTAKAALKVGAGKVSVLSPKCGVEVLQQSIPEAMVLASKNEKQVSKLDIDFTPETICIGMGLGKSIEALETLSHFINIANYPIIIDADGLNLLSENTHLLQELPKNTILTPHQGELKGLIGQWSDQYDKLKKMKQFVNNYDIILVSKDAYTFIVDKDKTYINSTGNAGMATAGSGDTLSGIISGLLAQNYLPIDAAVFGVYLHGLAADCYAQDYDENTLIASDIIDYLKNAFSFLKCLNISV